MDGYFGSPKLVAYLESADDTVLPSCDLAVPLTVAKRFTGAHLNCLRQLLLFGSRYTLLLD